MLKGVNKRIVEINNPDSLYFDKAVFYLKPSVRELPGTVTLSEADKILQTVGTDKFLLHKRRNTGKIVIFSLLAAAIAAAVIFALI